ncbi:MAG: hypothetical protein ACI4II_06545 [Acutalibacteraceae bacterium]
MKYCSDCKRIFEDNVNVCKICSAKLEDNVSDDSYVHIITATSMEKERIKIVFEDRGIDVQEKKEGKFRELFVKYKDIEKANKIIDDIDAVDLDYKFKKKKKKALAAQRTEENKADEKEKITEDVTEEKSEENTEEKSENAADDVSEDKSEKTPEEKNEKEEKPKTVDKKKSSDKERAKDKKKTKVTSDDDDDDDDDVEIGEVLATQDNDRSVYELFGFDKLDKGKRRLTMAVLWVLFIIVVFLIIAGVDMGVEFIKGLFE